MLAQMDSSVQHKAAAVSIISTLLSFFSEALPILQGIAVIVAIISGLFAIAVSIKRLRE